MSSKHQTLVVIPTAIALLAGVNNAISRDKPALDPNLISQQEMYDGVLSMKQIRRAGMLMFTTPFNYLDGFGDGPQDSSRPYTEIGNRPGIQSESMPFLRVNGLDAQTCLECHSVLSRANVPMTFAIGGHGGLNNSAVFNTEEIDVADNAHNHFAFLDGRFINPPFMFGVGGVELIGKEMTSELQAIKKQAQDAPVGTTFELKTKGVYFGTATSNGNGSVEVNIDNHYAINEDLVVRPFGRKGEFFSVRDFDVGAMAFHFGMQPIEVVGENVDEDGDGIVNEVTAGELSALSVFLTSMPRPIQEKLSPEARDGREIFDEVGCATCHVPAMETNSKFLTYSFPEVPADPSANVYSQMDMTQRPMRFKPNGKGGIKVSMYSDLKRHHMGEKLAETTGNELDPYFITAKLWGVMDSAPYLHDGRAMTITEAILFHGGEAEQQRKNFEKLSQSDKNKLLAFLKSLRAPKAEAITELTGK